MLIGNNYIDLNSVSHMANVVTKNGNHVIIVRLKDNKEPIWIENPNRLEVSDLIKENLNASNSNEKPANGKPANKKPAPGSTADAANAADAADAANAGTQTNSTSTPTYYGGNPF